jgi:D-cysteine desulfhydrase
MAVQSTPHLNLCWKNTPIEEFKYPLDKNSPKIFIKRDDLTGFLLSGNKVRKLEFILYDALKKKADTLITCGGFQSNHCRVVAILAAQFGLKSLLILWGDGEPRVEGNYFLDKLAGAKIKFVPKEKHEELDGIMSEEAKKLKLQGKNPYIIPEGASNHLGIWGYIQTAKEIKMQLDKLNLKIDKIITAVGSGGTYAGLFLGAKLFKFKARIIGFNVNFTANYFVEKIDKLMGETISNYNLNVKYEKGEIKIIDGYVGAGYGQTQEKEITLIKNITQKTGLIFDPVYTGKAMFGLLDQIRLGGFSNKEKILFLHTGGTFGLFPFVLCF